MAVCRSGERPVEWGRDAPGRRRLLALTALQGKPRSLLITGLN